jgi:hypothetical protein
MAIHSQREVTILIYIYGTYAKDGFLRLALQACDAIHGNGDSLWLVLQARYGTRLDEDCFGLALSTWHTALKKDNRYLIVKQHRREDSV